MKHLLLLFLFTSTGLFLFAQEKQNSQEPASAQPEIQFAETSHDFGAITEGPDYSYIFKFTNTGKAPLIISNVTSPCGCTTPDWTRTPVQPGKTGTITTIYHSGGKNGIFTKTLSVRTNLTSGNEKYITIRGEVKAKTESASN